MADGDENVEASIDRVVADLSIGDDGSFADLFDRYAARLAGLVRKRLGWKLARKIDPDDVVQSVFKSFVGLQRRRDVDCDAPALWGLLALMAKRKCGHKIAHFTAACRDVRAEESVLSAEPAGDADVRRFVEAISREPDPQEAAAVFETIRNLLEGLDDRDRTIVRRSLEGLSVEEISQEVQRSERTVQRVLKRLGETLRAEVPELSDPSWGSADAR